MSNKILDYIELNIEKIPKSLNSTKPKYDITKAFDNSSLYKVYKKISVKDLQILVGNSDRTTEIKERYLSSIPIQEYIEEHQEEFLELADSASIDKIKELEDMQEEFKDKIPYFIRYEKNYIWQIYYSKEEDKYFMLFPIREGEKEVLFYLLKQKLKKQDTSIYVPICKEDISEEYLNYKKINDIENYIWLFSKEWPNIYEVTTEAGTKLYITGKTKIQENLVSKYRIEINNEEEAMEEYSLLKALFIIATETKYYYNFKPQINDDGKLVFSFNDKVIDIKNLQEFISEETAKQHQSKFIIKEEIDRDKEKLDKLKDIVNKQNDIYIKQEKQIITFMDCRKSFFKKVKFFFKNNKKFSLANKKNISNLEKEIKESEQIKENQEEVSENILNEMSNLFTIADLVKTTLETKNVINQQKGIKADIRSLKLKQINMTKKIENAQNYIDEIEKNKKSLFEFWKFANKDNQKALEEGNQEEQQEKKQPVFNLDDDMEMLATNADALQRKKLSNEECNAVYVAKWLLDGINSIVTKSDTYVIDEEFDKLKAEYNPQNSYENIFAGIEEDYTKVKELKNKQHRENHKNIYSILKFNETTTLDDFKERMRENSTLVNETYQKITSIYNMPIYYSYRKKGYIMGEINPYNLIEDESVEKIYKTYTNNETHLIYLSNIIMYDNLNKTLPLGMDESTAVILKVGENKKIKETNINLIKEEDLFNIKIRKIKMIEEGKKPTK